MQLLIFDVDGTLVDSQDAIVESQRRTFLAHDLPAPDRKTALSVVGLSLREAFTALVGPDGPIDSMAEHYKNAFSICSTAPAGTSCSRRRRRPTIIRPSPRRT